MVIANAIGNAIGVPFGGASQSWESYLGNNSSLWIKENSRDGLTLTDSLNPGVNDATIKLPYLHLTGNQYFYLADNGALDIYTNDITIGCWVRGLDTGKAANNYIMGKPNANTLEGRFNFTQLQTTGYLSFAFQPSGGIKSIASTIDATSGWHFLIADINQTTKIGRFFIDGNQIGSDTSFTGTFAHLDNAYEFYIGAGNNGTSNVTGINKMDFYNGFLLHRVMTDTERANAMLGIFPIDCKVYYPCLSINSELRLIDASGNGYNMLAGGSASPLSSKINMEYGDQGSKYGLDYGFTLYENGLENLYMPLSLSGNEITPYELYTTAGYRKTKEGVHYGNSQNHNLANSMIHIPGDFWDRSDTGIWNDFARSATSYYNSDNPNWWHPTELNNLMIQSWANAGYKKTGYVKVSDHSYKDRKILKDIFSFALDRSDSINNDILNNYCLDYVFTDTYENDYIYWKPEANSIIAVRGLKQLKYVHGTPGTFHLSIDGGLTYPYSINNPDSGKVPRFAYIFANGNILMTNHLHVFLSTNNLTTFPGISVTGVDGNPFVASDQVYFAITKSPYIDVDGNEMFVLGSYALAVATAYININLFYTIDSGVTFKSCYLADVTDPPNLPARHIHCAVMNPNDNSIWIATGDGAPPGNDCNFIKGIYDWNLDTWTWSKLYGDADTGMTYKVGYIGFFGDTIIATNDNTSASTNTKWGIWKCAIADLGDSANFEVVYRIPKESALMYCNDPVVIASIGNVENSCVIQTSNDGVDNIRGHKLYGLPLTTVNFYQIEEKNTNGWYLARAKLNATDIDELNKDSSLWIKFK